jgi:hypothetical protein
MSNKYKFRDQDKPYFVSFSVVYWPGVFIRDVYRDILLASLRYGRQNKGLEVYARVVVTNRAHPATGRKGGDEMPGTARGLKKHPPPPNLSGRSPKTRPGRALWTARHIIFTAAHGIVPGSGACCRAWGFCLVDPSTQAWRLAT